jgi:hypothetical protein
VRYLFDAPQFTSMMPKTVWGIVMAGVMALIFISLWFYKQKKAII